LLAGDELVEGFFDQLGRNGIVGFASPLSQDYWVVVVRPFFRPLAGCLPGFSLGADAGTGETHINMLRAAAAAIFVLLDKLSIGSVAIDDDIDFGAGVKVKVAGHARLLRSRLALLASRRIPEMCAVCVTIICA